jgi:hypothetical protein
MFLFIILLFWKIDNNSQKQNSIEKSISNLNSISLFNASLQNDQEIKRFFHSLKEFEYVFSIRFQRTTFRPLIPGFYSDELWLAGMLVKEFI